MSEMKLCTECRHYNPRSDAALAFCGAHTPYPASVDPVHGGHETMAQQALCRNMRRPGDLCGPDAKLFEPKESEEEVLLWRAARSYQHAITNADGNQRTREIKAARAFLRGIRDGVTQEICRIGDQANQDYFRSDRYIAAPAHVPFRAMLDKLIGDKP